MESTQNKVELLFKENYLTAIKNSVGSKMFRNLYAEVDDKKTDITENGVLSCSLFVTSILYLSKLIREMHVTVNGTVKDLEESGWFEIVEPKEGAVILWEEFDFGDGDMHRHVGFYIGDNKAVSNDYVSGLPAIHDWKYNGQRGIEKILWHQKLD